MEWWHSRRHHERDAVHARAERAVHVTMSVMQCTPELSVQCTSPWAWCSARQSWACSARHHERDAVHVRAERAVHLTMSVMQCTSHWACRARHSWVCSARHIWACRARHRWVCSAQESAARRRSAMHAQTSSKNIKTKLPHIAISVSCVACFRNVLFL